MTTSYVQDAHNTKLINWPTIFRLFGLPILLGTLILYFSLTTETFLTTENISGMLQSWAISSIMFLALTWCFTIGEMEVSFVSIAALANMIAAGLVISGFGWGIATFVALTASVAVGACNGFLIAKLGLPSLVTTIATGSLASALAAAIGRGSSVPVSEESFLAFFLDTHIFTIPCIVFLALFLITCALWVEYRLRLGHYIFAMATNSRAVLEAGIPVIAITVAICVVSAFLNGFSGILIAVELSSGQPSIAQSLFLDGLTAVLLGSTMMKLGKPNILGTVTSVLIIAVLVRGGAMHGWSDASFQIIKGVLLIVGVASVLWSKQHTKG